MLQNYTTYKILQLFFDSPTKHFQLREICRLLKFGMPSVKNHIKMLENEKFIIKEKKGIYYSYVSSMNEKFKLYKKNDILIRLHESGLIKFLEDSFVPDSIVLFGSASRGEDVEHSDIDLFVIAKERNVDLKKFELAIKRKINLHFEEKTSHIPKELLNNVINGIIVSGYLEVFD